MTTWTTITEATIFPRQAELEALRDIQLPDGVTGASLLASAIAQEVQTATGYLRAAVAKGYLSRLGPDGTVPPSLVGALAVLVRRSVISRIPGLQSMHNQIREDEVTDANRLIRDVATGANRVDEPYPTTPDASPSTPAPSIADRVTSYQREDSSGL